MAMAKIIGRLNVLHLELLNRGTSLSAVRTYKQHRFPYDAELYHRRLKVGPIKETPQSKRLNWNEDIELYAFSHRISENVSRVGLRQAFTDRSFSESTALLVKETIGQLTTEEESADLIDDSRCNEHLAASGRKITERYIDEFIRGQLPHLSGEGVSAILTFLMSTEKLAHVGRHLGITDIVLYDGFPVPEEALATSLLALISVLDDEQGVERAQGFVRDFILSQLIGVDIDNIYHITDAMNKLVKLLEKQGKGEPIPRLLDQFGQETLVSCYLVGIYSDNQLIGKASGETLEIAEDMASRDALMTHYGIQDHRLPFDFNTSYKQFGILNGGTQPQSLT